MSECVFCSIVAEDSPAYRIYDDEKTLAFLDVNPATRGHILVIPKAHHETISDMPRDLVGNVFQTVHTLTTALESAFDPDGINLIQSNGEAAGQEVFHAHVHILPRYGDENVTLRWTDNEVDESTQRQITTELRSELDSL